MRGKRLGLVLRMRHLFTTSWASCNSQVSVENKAGWRCPHAENWQKTSQPHDIHDHKSSLCLNFTLKSHDLSKQHLFSLFRKAASAQQPVGSVSVSECCQPQRERPRQNGPRPAHPDVCHCGNSPAHFAGPPPLLSTCKSLTVSHYWSSLSHKHTEEVASFLYRFYFGWVYCPSSASFLLCLSCRVICWVVPRVWPTNQRQSQSLTACAGSSPHWVGSSSWVAIGPWSQRALTGCTLLRETQVCWKLTTWPMICFALYVFTFLSSMFSFKIQSKKFKFCMLFVTQDKLITSFEGYIWRIESQSQVWHNVKINKRAIALNGKEKKNFLKKA